MAHSSITLNWNFWTEWGGDEWGAILTLLTIIGALLGFLYRLRRSHQDELRRQSSLLDDRIARAVEAALPDVQNRLLEQAVWTTIGRRIDQIFHLQGRADALQTTIDERIVQLTATETKATNLLRSAEKALEMADEAVQRTQASVQDLLSDQRKLEERMHLIFEADWMERTMTVCKTPRTSRERQALGQELVLQFRESICYAVFEVPHAFFTTWTPPSVPLGVEQRKELARKCRDGIKGRICDLSQPDTVDPSRSLRERVRRLCMEIVFDYVRALP